MIQRKTPTVLLSGWLFADLLLGLMMIFLAALPGKPPEAPILKVDKSLLGQTDTISPCVQASNSNANVLLCSVEVTVSESSASLGSLTWHVSSDVGTNVAFSPASTTLAPGKGQEVQISQLPCQNGSITFTGVGTHDLQVQPVTVGWHCTTPAKHVDFTSHRIVLNVDYQGLLNGASGAISDTKNQIMQKFKTDPTLNGHTVAFAIVYGGSPGLDNGAPAEAEEVAAKVYQAVLSPLKMASPVFQYAAFYSQNPLFTSVAPYDSFNVVVIDVYLYTF